MRKQLRTYISLPFHSQTVSIVSHTQKEFGFLWDSRRDSCSFPCANRFSLFVHEVFLPVAVHFNRIVYAFMCRRSDFDNILKWWKGVDGKTRFDIWCLECCLLAVYVFASYSHGISTVYSTKNTWMNCECMAQFSLEKERKRETAKYVDANFFILYAHLSPKFFLGSYKKLIPDLQRGTL